MEHTDWFEVARAGMSTSSFNIDARNEALLSILQRFQKPLIYLFRRQLQNLGVKDEDCTQDIFVDFSVYVMEKRKKIFRRADPEKGKLRSFIFTIASRFFQRRVHKYLRCGVPFDPEALDHQQQRDAEKAFEIDYVNVLLNNALKELKLRDRLENKAMYRMFKRKYFNKEGRELTALELAGEFTEISADTKNKDRKKIEDRVHQRICKAKNLFLKFLGREIRKALMLEDNIPIPHEEQALFCKYITWIEVDTD